MENQNKTPDTQNVFELAIVLGKALKADPRLVRMENARKAYEQVKNWSARGWMPGSEYARSREEAIRDK